MNPVPAAAPRYQFFSHLRHPMNTSIIRLLKQSPFAKGVQQLIVPATGTKLFGVGGYHPASSIL
jgi:hypothetical protein